jgi:uroporphyrin-III C-methyltransferase / precorrin-2 dehydrogenase / sirohydrochlorin ferrochelatase
VLLELAPKARRFFVGKRAGRHSLEQTTIHRIMIRAAKRGERVVRLKAGDPFVFGRGGEEAIALLAAGLQFEVIPGVSSALAGPALAGIPVTHRGLASGFVVVSGHAPTAWQPVLAGLSAASVTIVVLMGMAARKDIAHFLLERGFSATTPVAIVCSASQPEQTRWLGTLNSLAHADLAHHDGPGVLVIGQVVELAKTLSPCEPITLAALG